ncbi:4Fe-4S dicluster domain-containing protein [Chloroflexota bacterium]
MTDILDKVIDEKKLSLCVECGKCVAGCPLAELHERFSKEFSARGIIKRALMGFDVWKNKEIWFCLGCNVCAQSCPAGVRYAEFIEGVRQLALSESITEYCLFCERCGCCYLPMPTLEYMRGTLEKTKADSQFLNLCPECRNRDFAERVKFPSASAK